MERHPGGAKWGWTETNIDLTNYGSVWNPIDYWVNKYGTLKVWYIGILLEYWAVDPEGFGEPLYADELILNGVTYNIAPYAGAPSPTPNQSSYKISGYILDANHRGIGGADIIFNEPNTVPGVYSDSAGYYAIYAPAGTYNVNVWPPFDSNYIDYDERGFVVTSDMTKNITLNSGFKVSGYIISTTGQPVKDGIVLLNNYLSGWFSKDTGYYFVCAPAGTYKLWASPRNGYNHFLVYSESNFVLDRNIAKNITVVLTNTTTQPSPEPTPTPTPEPTSDQAWISISVDAKSPVVGSPVSVRGRLTDYQGLALINKPVTLSYANANTPELLWTKIGAAFTSSKGDYYIQWTIAEAGNFLFKVEWLTSDNFPAAMNTSSVGFLPEGSKYSLPAVPDQLGNTITQQTFAVETEQVNADAGDLTWIAVAAVVVVIALVVASIIAVRTVKNRKISGAAQKVDAKL